MDGALYENASFAVIVTKDVDCTTKALSIPAPPEVVSLQRIELASTQTVASQGVPPTSAVGEGSVAPKLLPLTVMETIPWLVGTFAGETEVILACEKASRGLIKRRAMQMADIRDLALL
jgi:hypothetical protein